MTQDTLVAELKLQFGCLGYEVKEPPIAESGTFVAHHRYKANLVVRVFKTGEIRLNTAFKVAALTPDKRALFLEVLNALNHRAVGVSFSLNAAVALSLQAWFVGAYDRVTFARFLDQFWNNDVRVMVSRFRETPELRDSLPGNSNSPAHRVPAVSG